MNQGDEIRRRRYRPSVRQSLYVLSLGMCRYQYRIGICARTRVRSWDRSQQPDAGAAMSRRAVSGQKQNPRGEIEMENSRRERAAEYVLPYTCLRPLSRDERARARKSSLPAAESSSLPGLTVRAACIQQLRPEVDIATPGAQHLHTHLPYMAISPDAILRRPVRAYVRLRTLGASSIWRISLRLIRAVPRLVASRRVHGPAPSHGQAGARVERDGAERSMSSDCKVHILSTSGC